MNRNLTDLTIMIDMINTVIRLGLRFDDKELSSIGTQFAMIKYRSHENINDMLEGKFKYNY